jgi:hypothetical protein
MTCVQLAARLHYLQSLAQHVHDPEAQTQIAAEIAQVIAEQQRQGCLQPSSAWIEQGPGPLNHGDVGYNQVAGAIEAVATDPRDRDRVFVAAVGGGIWSSNNATSATPTWSPLTDLAPSLSMSAVTISPLDRLTIYAGCGATSHSAPLVGASNGPLLGVLKSTDGGKHWTELARETFRGRTVKRILASTLTSAQGQVVLAATWGGGLLRSSDGGTTWTKLDEPGDFVSDVVVDPGDAQRVWAAGPKGVFRSDDGGNAVWTDVTAGLGTLPFTDIKLSASSVTDSNGHRRIYVLVTDRSLLFTADAGATWHDMGRPSDGAGPVPGFAASPLQFDIVFTASNEGRHWMARSAPDVETPAWAEVEGNGRTDTAPAAGAVSNHIFIAVKGLGGNLFLNQADLGGHFGQWFSMDFTTDVAPAVCGVGDHVYFFAKNLDGRIFYNHAKLGQGGQGWKEVEGGGLTDVAPAAAAVGTHVFVAIKGLDGQLQLNQADLGGSFGQWFTMGFSSNVAPALCGAGGSIYFFARSGDGRVFTNSAVLGQGGGDWKPIDGDLLTDVAPAAGGVGTHVYVAIEGRDGNLHMNQSAGGAFGQWLPLGFATDTSAAVVGLVNNVDVFGKTADGRIMVRHATLPEWTIIDLEGASGTATHTDARSCAFAADGNTLFETDDGGIYRLTNAHGLSDAPARRWDPAVGNLRIAEFHAVAYDSRFHVVFGATQDNSIPQQTVPGQIAWDSNEDAWGDGFEVGVDVTSTPQSSIHYSSQQNLFHFRRRTYTSPTNVISDIGVPIVIAGTGGLTYNQVEGALRDDGGLGTVRWNQSWVVNDADPTRLLLGTDFLYESFDRGDTFTSLGGLAKNAKNEWIPANAIGTVHSYAYGHALNPDVIYVGASNKLLLRESGQGLPKVVESYPGSTPVGIAVAGSSWRVAYVLDNAGRVWRTNDAGATAARWSELTSNLLSLTTDLRTIATLTPKSRFVLETLFVAGQGGVFVASADAITGRFGAWRKQGTGFPNAIITGLQSRRTTTCSSPARSVAPRGCSRTSAGHSRVFSRLTSRLR